MLCKSSWSWVVPTLMVSAIIFSHLTTTSMTDVCTAEHALRWVGGESPRGEGTRFKQKWCLK